MPVASRYASLLGRSASSLALILSGALAAPGAFAQDSTVVLNELVLDGERATENSGEYTTSGSSGTAAGLALTVKETPQSMTVTTNQQIVDQNMETLDEVIEWTPGLSAMQGNGEFRWSFIARGSIVENQQFDGVPNYVHYYSRDVNPQEDMAMYDRVEVVRGATGLLEGSGSPAASVNLVRKMPTAEHQSSVEAAFSSFDNVRMVYDTSGPISSDGRLRGRFVASGLTGDGQRDNLRDDRGLLYGVLEYDLTEQTTVSAGLSYAKEKIDGYSWGGVWTAQDGSFFDFDGSTSPSLDWEYSDREQTVGYLEAKHVFGNGWTLNAKLRVSDGSSDMFTSYMRYSTAGDLERSGGRYEYISQTNSLDVNASGKVTLFGREHDLAFGINGSRDRTRYDGGSDYLFIIPDPSVADPHAEPRPPFSPPSYFSDMVTKNYGIYASARWTLAEGTKLITGGRLSWYDYSDDGNWGGSELKIDEEFVPYLGLVHDVNDKLTVYGSYTSIFLPQASYGVNGLLDPVEGKNYELGAKATLNETGLTGSIALFQTDQDGISEPDREHSDCSGPGPTCYVNSGLVRTRGVELELAGAISERWNISASYTYANSKIQEGTDEGERFRTYMNPQRIAKLSTAYRLGGALEGLTLGGSVRYQSEIYLDGLDGGDWTSGGAPFYLHQGGYTLVDVMARYDLTEDTEIQLNIDNLLDKNYYSALTSVGYGNFIGAERNATLTLRQKF